MTSHQNERGTLLLLTVVAIVCLVAFIALAIDGARLLLAQEDKVSTAEVISLAALERYLDSSGTTHDDKVSDAILRAEAVGGLNFSLIESAPQVASGELVSETSGRIVAGRWWSSPPSVCNISGCPCSGPTPCFEACTNSGCTDPDTGVTGEGATAFGAALYTRPSAPVMNFFAHAIGASSNHVYGGAAGQVHYATLAPKNVLLMINVDISATLDSDGHYYRYPLVNYEAGPGSHPWYIPTYFGYSCGSPLTPMVTNYFGAWNALTPAEQAAFRCYPGNLLPRSVFPPTPRLIDVQRDAEPYATLLEAAGYAAQEFNLRARPEDRLAAYAYSMEYGMNPNWERFYAFERRNAATLTNFIDMSRRLSTHPGEVDTIVRERLQKLFVPEYGSPEYTSTIKRGRELLQTRANFMGAENHIILFAGGISVDGPPPSGNGTLMWALFEPNYGRWPEVFASHQGGYRNMVTLASTFVPERVFVHVVDAGSYSRPHRLFFPSLTRSGECMDEAERNERGYPEVLSGANDSNYRTLANIAKPGAEPYFYHSRMLAKAARVTGGRFLMLTPPCPAGTAQSIASACASASTAGMPAQFTSDDPRDALPYIVTDNGLRSSNLQDSEGRVLCDPARRTNLQQIQDLMTFIAEKRSYVLVK